MASRCVDCSGESDGDTYLLLQLLFSCHYFYDHLLLTITLSFPSAHLYLSSSFTLLFYRLPTKNDELDTQQLLVACSPLLALFYVIYTGFEDEEKEQAKRRQKGDFALDGHGE